MCDVVKMNNLVVYTVLPQNKGKVVLLTFRLEGSAFPVSTTTLDCVIMCSINLEQEACSIIPSSSEAGNDVMYPEG